MLCTRKPSATILFIPESPTIGGSPHEGGACSGFPPCVFGCSAATFLLWSTFLCDLRLRDSDDDNNLDLRLNCGGWQDEMRRTTSPSTDVTSSLSSDVDGDSVVTRDVQESPDPPWLRTSLHDIGDKTWKNITMQTAWKPALSDLSNCNSGRPMNKWFIRKSSESINKTQWPAGSRYNASTSTWTMIYSLRK